MDEKSSDVVNNICTILGGALLLYPIIEQATKTIIPEMQKLQSGETLKELRLPPPEQEKEKQPHEEKQSERDDDHKKHESEIAELKRKLAEFEGKSESN